MDHLYSTALLAHLLGFAGWIGAGIAQQRFMSASRTPRLEPILRDQYERLSALLVTRIELVAVRHAGILLQRSRGLARKSRAVPSPVGRAAILEKEPTAAQDPSAG